MPKLGQCRSEVARERRKTEGKERKVRREEPQPVGDCRESQVVYRAILQARERLGKEYQVGDNNHLEPLVHRRRHRDNVSWGLNDVHGAAREPGPFESRQERLLDNQRPNTGRESEHLVEANGHRINWRICQRYHRSRCKRCRIEERVVSQGGGVMDQRQGIFCIRYIRLPRQREEAWRRALISRAVPRQHDLGRKDESHRTEIC